MVVDPTVRSAVITEKHQTGMIASTASVIFQSIINWKAYTLLVYKPTSRMYRHNCTKSWQDLGAVSE